MHVARLKFPAPGTEETWVTDGAGDPLLVVMAQPSSSLASQIRGLLPQPRGIAGQDRKVTLCFDRGGWSPDLNAPGVIYRMTCRWREESYFRYGRAHFAPGALDSYATVPDDPRRLVPNPAKKTAAAAVTAAKNAAAKAEAGAAGETHRAAQPRPRDQHHHHQQDARPAPGSRPRRPPPGPSRRRSRSASTTPGRCGWRPR